MKKLIIATAIIFSLSFGAAAQSDGFFNNWQNIDDPRSDVGNNIELPGLPAGHGYENDQDAPLGGGLLILSALGVGYAGFRKRDKR